MLETTAHDDDDGAPGGPQVAIITGGASGVGLATTRRLLADGWAVTVVDADPRALSDLEKTATAELLATVQCDVRDDAAVGHAVDVAVDRFGTITGLCTCAAVKRRGPLHEMSPAVWRETIDINLTGTFLAIRHVLPVMMGNRYGRIVTVSSASGYAETNAAGYAASKGAILALTRSLALEGLPHHIAVNCVVPGVTRTPMNTLDEGELTERGRRNVSGRVNTADDVAMAIRFLLSSEASTTSGAVLDVGRIQGAFAGV
jgi:NAD(P)-dependent dehydrogenase (short-subunit alcohol dehydrogenase family)